ncbi:MAG TPA: Uma2 family endonuclease [Thermoanaerobaculia bacterium]|jgi:Uma2 family endonuclease
MPLPALSSESDAEATFLADEEPEGYVLRPVELADGRVEVQQLPLTIELLLDPREGDKVTQSDFHGFFLSSLLERLRRLERVPGVAVFTDLLFQWDKLGLPDSGPDVAVVAGLEGTREEIMERVEGCFDVAAIGRRPHLVIEVVSPEHGRLRRKDLAINREIYARAGVREYLIVNPIGRRSPGPLQLLGYRLEGGPEYTEIEPDEKGRILSQTTGLLFWSDPGGRRIEVFDAATGERLLTGQEEAARAEAAEERAEREAGARKAAEARALAAEGELRRFKEQLKAQRGRQD